MHCDRNKPLEMGTCLNGYLIPEGTYLLRLLGIVHLQLVAGTQPDGFLYSPN